MARRARRPWAALLLVFVLGAIVGHVLAESVRHIPSLSFLARTLALGLEPPVRLDLALVTLTFGFTVRLNLAVVLGILIALVAWRLV